MIESVSYKRHVSPSHYTILPSFTHSPLCVHEVRVRVPKFETEDMYS